MKAFPRSSADYLGAFLSMLPRGAAWPRDPTSVLVQTSAALMPGYAAADAAACALLVDSFPSTAVGLLPEWEATLGLPDPCLGPAPTIAQRQALVTAKLTGRGGQDAAYFERLALNIGFVVTVQNYAPARFGRLKFGQPLFDAKWAHAWSVTGPLGPVTTLNFAGGRFGQPFRSWANPVLECQLREYAPAHAQLFFLYEPQGFFLDRTPLS